MRRGGENVEVLQNRKPTPAAGAGRDLTNTVQYGASQARGGQRVIITVQVYIYSKVGRKKYPK